MKFFGKCFFAFALICAFSTTLSFAQDEASADVKNFNDEFRAIRAEALARFDTDGKGYFTSAEWPGRNRAFRLMDVNRDGRISLEEFQSLRNRWQNRTFENMDIKGNRVITRDEWMDIPEDFDRLDRNKDGMIQRNEFYNPK
jgi:hypothetical protein